MRFTQKGEVWHCGSITLAFFSTSITKMKHLFSKGPKKPPKYSQRDLFLGIPINVAAGPLGFRAELNIASEGERSFLPSLIWTQIGLIRPWHQMKRVTGVHGSYFRARLTRVKGLLRRKLPPPVLWMSVTPTTDMPANQVSVLDPCYFDWRSRGSQCLSAPEGDTADTGDGEVEPSEPSRRTCRYRFRVGFLLTHTSCEKELDEYRSRSWWHFVRCSNGGFRCIRSSQSSPGRYLCHLRKIRSTSISFRLEQTPDGLACRKQSPSGKKFKASVRA